MKAKNVGSSFDDFLREKAILDEATAVAVKRVIVRTITLCKLCYYKSCIVHKLWFVHIQP